MCVSARTAGPLAGDPGKTLIEECRKRLERFSPERRNHVAALLTDAEEALRLRHEVVHSLWPFSGAGPVRGWRNVPKNRREDPNRHVEWTAFCSEDLPSLVKDLVELVDRCRQVEQWVPPAN